MISLSRCLAQPVPTDRPCAHLLFQVAKGRYHSAKELLTEWRQMDLKHVANCFSYSVYSTAIGQCMHG